MLKIYLTIAYRNFFRNKIFSFINVAGLAIGISASLVIFLIVHYDFTFDKFEKNRSRLYRVVTEANFFGTVIHNPGVPSPLAEAVSKEVAGIENIISFHKFNGDPKVSAPRKDEKPFTIRHQKNIILADESYFKLVPYQWLAGSLHESLAGPFKVVLSAERAKIYFPGISYSGIIGRQLTYDDSIVATVSGIVNDLNQNTDFIFKEFLSQSTLSASEGLKRNYHWDNWGSINGGTQLLLKLSEQASPKSVEAGIQSLEIKNDKENTHPNSKRYFHLQPFDDIHFSPVYATFGERSASKPVLYGLLAVGTFLLLLACINFINLTTAQSIHRAKEIGVRKTLGSSGRQLIFQFLTETFFISFISLIISIALTPLLLKIFSDFIPADLHFDLLHQPYIIGFGFVLTVIVALLAGFYPALVLSRFRAVQVLKNQAYTGSGGSRRAVLRKTLTISQFLIAQVFTMATFIAVKQIHFVLNRDMGFKKDAIVNIETPFLWKRNGPPNTKRISLLEKIKNIPGVQLASLGNEPPAADGWSSSVLKFKDGKKEIETDVRQKNGDTNYLKLYHIRLLAGRNVRASDTANEVVINETYMHILGFQNPEQVLNREVDNIPIVGVMADFNQESLHEPVKPIAFSCEMGNCWILHVALQTGEAQAQNWKTTLASIEKTYKEFFPEEDFSYNFLDESIAKFYTSEKNLSRLLTWAAGIAIFISCMGLLGLVIYTTNQRTKEIGVRKVLGASVSNIVSILSRDFVWLVLIASFIAIPLTWWAMHKWLENFAYQTPVSWWVFGLSILSMMAMAVLTLSIQTIRAANANPVDSLRTE
jgi:ABC-type antimicrobial peptide transport system permease subunit